MKGNIELKFILIGFGLGRIYERNIRHKQAKLKDRLKTTIGTQK